MRITYLRIIFFLWKFRIKRERDSTKSRKHFRLEVKSSRREGEKYLMQHTVERGANARYGVLNDR